MTAVPRDAEAPRRTDGQFALLVALFAAGLAALPLLLAQLGGTPGLTYLGYVWNADDHMVYAAWTRQAMEGRFLFDNRFTTDPQPGLTVHLYFWLLGQLAKVFGIVGASQVARIGLTFAFVLLLHRFLRRLNWPVFETKLALTLATFGAGAGFLFWQTFGWTIDHPTPEAVRALTAGQLPIDVYQPEAFVFPSLLTNGLFMAALCLILITLTAFLEAEKSWRPVAGGAVAYGLLMNIHSYDALLVAFVMVGFLVMAWARDQVTGGWIGRALAIGAGALPPALWFVYVLRQDAVFRARAATETFSPNFRAVVFGLLGLVGLGLFALAHSRGVMRRGRFAAIGFVVLLIGLYALAGGHTQGYFLNPVAWGLLYAATLAVLYAFATLNPARNLVAAWALVGLVAIYFPALFQRKLAMGIAIPWAILAAAGLGLLLKNLPRPSRNLTTALLLVVLCATSVRWLGREVSLARQNVSNTTVHPAYLTGDMVRILTALDEVSGRKVVLAMPGVSARLVDESQAPVPDAFGSPLMPDLNPIVSGLTGAYTVAGHWSETPDYNRRRGGLTRLFLNTTPEPERQAALREYGADYVIAPVPESFPELPLADLSREGEVVVDGGAFRLVRLTPPG